MKKRIVAFITILVFSLLAAVRASAADSLEDGVNELARQIVEKSQAENKKSIAVAAFPHGDGSLSVLSNYLVDELILSLFSIDNKNLQIVERSQLESIFQELQRSEAGIIDVNTARELGKLHGVGALVIGSITKIGDTVRVIARMIETETGKVFSAAATTIPRTETIDQLMDQRISAVQRPRPANVPSTTGPGGKSPVFENEHFKVEVISLTRQPEGPLLKLGYLSRSDKATMWYLDNPKENTYLTDENDNTYAFKKSKLEKWAEFAPRGYRIVTIAFRDQGGSAKEFSFTSKMSGRLIARFFVTIGFIRAE